MKKVLVIGYVWPEPASSAAGSHMLSILRLFRQQGYQVEFATPAQPTEHMADLSSENITSRSINLNCDSFDKYVSEYQPDIVLFDRFMMEEQFGWRVEKNCPGALKILDTEDLQCLRQARHHAIKAGKELLQRDLSSNLAKREIAAILRCDLSLIISDFEMELLRDTFKVDPALLHYLPFMVELENCPQHTLSFSERKHFMMIGNFRHAPNWDAVLYLNTIWPVIRKKLPTAECHIYGSYPTPKAMALNNPDTGFLIKGWVKDAHAVFEKSRVCLAPLRFGAGIKGKLLDAMIMQTPSVTTSIGSEGMHKQLPWPGIIADNINDFADAAVSLYNNENKWLDAQKNTTIILNEIYDGKISAQQLIQRIENIIENMEQHRTDNFTGAMLKHHSMMSTKYMSQWIEEKNKNK